MVTIKHFCALASLAVLLSASTGKADETLIATNDTWLYYSDGTLPAPNWNVTMGYSDVSWSSGPAPLGYGDPAIATTVPYGTNASDKWRTYYYRKHFTVPNPGFVTGLVAQLIADDGAAVYVNGVLVHRTANMPSSFNNDSFTLGNVAEPYVWQQFTISPTHLMPGDNVFAVETHQDDAGSSDTYLNLMLTSVDYATTNQPGGYPDNWTAYNDPAWMDGDSLATAFTTNSPVGQLVGALITEDGLALPANQISFATNGLIGLNFNGYTVTQSLMGAAATEFGGKFGTNHFVIWNSNSLGITLSGLASNKQYKVVLLCTRGEVSSEPDNFYTNRLTDVVISSVDSFINSSSVGNNSSKFTTTMTDDSTRMQADITLGHVVRFDQVRPGVDGTVILSLTPNTSLNENRAYLNAIKIVESNVTGGGDGDADGMDDAWETGYFGSTGQGTTGDFDNDGSINYDEYIAGTDPTSGSSKLEVTSTVTNAPGTVIVRWAGVIGKTYTVQSATAVTSNWATLQSGIPGASPTTVYTGTTATAKRFMRVKVE